MASNQQGNPPATAAPDTVEIDETNRFILLDLLDEAQLAAEMAGEVVSTYVYAVEEWDTATRSKVLRHQLSKSGVDAACRGLAEIHEYIREMEIDQQIDRQSEEAFFRCKVGRYRRTKQGDEVLLDVAHGVKRQPMYYVSKRDQSHIPNPHWYEHGMMKACRNGRRRMIPEKFAIELIAGWLKEGGRVQTIDMTNRQRRGQAAAPVSAPVVAGPVAAPAVSAERQAVPRAESREDVLAKVAAELDANFGEGEPAKVPMKDAVLRRIFRTSDWPSLKRMPEARFFQLWDYARFSDAIVLVTEEGGAA